MIAPDSKAVLLAGVTFFDPPCFLLCVLRKFVFAAKRAWASTSTDGSQIEQSFPSSARWDKDKDKQQHHRIIKVQFHLLPSVYFLQSQAIAAIPPSLPRLDWLLRSGLVADCGWVRSWAGTKVGYKPDVVVGGKDLEHDWRVHRGIGYFIEPLVLLGLFARSTLSIRLKAEGCFLILFLLEVN